MMGASKWIGILALMLLAADAPSEEDPGGLRAMVIAHDTARQRAIEGVRQAPTLEVPDKVEDADF